MLQLPIGRLIWTFHSLSVFTQVLATKLSAKQNLVITDSDYHELLKAAEEFSSLCSDVSLSVTHEMSKLICSDLGRATKNDSGNWLFSIQNTALIRCETSLKQLIGCIRAEATTKSAMILPPEKAALYSPDNPLWGGEIRNKFPSAIYDIDEAAKCLALERPTAAVFHVMRVVEVAMKAISKCLGLQEPNNPNWGAYLKLIRDECESRGKSWTDWQLFQDIWQRIDSIKDAQRNTTLHVETIHTPEEAEFIFKATEGLMKKIADQMDENGQPLA